MNEKEWENSFFPGPYFINKTDDAGTGQQVIIAKGSARVLALLDMSDGRDDGTALLMAASPVMYDVIDEASGRLQNIIDTYHLPDEVVSTLLGEIKCLQHALHVAVTPLKECPSCKRYAGEVVSTLTGKDAVHGDIDVDTIKCGNCSEVWAY